MGFELDLAAIRSAAGKRKTDPWLMANVANVANVATDWVLSGPWLLATLATVATLATDWPVFVATVATVATVASSHGAEHGSKLSHRTGPTPPSPAG